MKQHNRSYWLLFIPLIVYIIIVMLWFTRHLYLPTGDEPHYLVISESLIRDGDLIVGNNYQSGSTIQHVMGKGFQAGPHVVGEVSVHAPGLGVLLSLPYMIGGVFGAKLALALINGIWPFLVYRSLLTVLKAHSRALAWTLVLSFGLPFTAAAAQIYPDLIGGLLIFAAALQLRTLLQSKSTFQPRVWEQLGLGGGLAILPWLHMRLIAPAALLLLAYVYTSYKQSKRSTFLTSWSWMLPLIGFSLILLPLLRFNLLHFGRITGWFGTHSLNLSLRHGAMVFMGLHWDQTQGMFLQQPLLLLGLIGLPIWLQRERRFAVVLGLVYLSVIIPNSMHGIYGGESFWGRFGWSVFALWVFPFAHAIEMIKKRVIWVTMSICSALYQTWLASKWLLLDGFLYRRDAPFWSDNGWSFFLNNSFTEIGVRCPVFQTPNIYLHHPANYVFPFFGCILIFIGVLLLQHKRKLIYWVLESTICLSGLTLYMFPPVPGSWVLYPYQLPAKVGEVIGWTRVALEGRDIAGDIVSPFTIRLPAGNYRFDIVADITGIPTAGSLQWEIIRDTPHRVLAKGYASVIPDINQDTKKIFSVDIEETASSETIWIHIEYTGEGNIVLKRLYITPILESPFKRHLW